MRHRTFLIGVCVGLVATLVLSVGALADEGGRPFTTTLTGAAEIPGPTRTAAALRRSD